MLGNWRRSSRGSAPGRPAYCRDQARPVGDGDVDSALGRKRDEVGVGALFWKEDFSPASRAAARLAGPDRTGELGTFGMYPQPMVSSTGSARRRAAPQALGLVTDAAAVALVLARWSRSAGGCSQGTPWSHGERNGRERLSRGSTRRRRLRHSGARRLGDAPTRTGPASFHPDCTVGLGGRRSTRSPESLDRGNPLDAVAL